MFKKMLMIGMAALMVFVLGACGNGESPAEGSTDKDSSLKNDTESVSKTSDVESGESNRKKTDADSELWLLYQKFLKSMGSLLEELRKRISPGWLKVAAGFIYNSGRRLEPYPQTA